MLPVLLLATGYNSNLNVSLANYACIYELGINKFIYCVQNVIIIFTNTVVRQMITCDLMSYKLMLKIKEVL